MDLYNVLIVLLTMSLECDLSELTTRVGQGTSFAYYRTQVERDKLHRVTDLTCGNEQFLSVRFGHQVQVLYDGTSLTGSCVLHIYNNDTERYKTLCIKLGHAFTLDNSFHCQRHFRLYFGDFPSKHGSRYFSCKDVFQQVCGTPRTAHIVFTPPLQDRLITVTITTHKHVSKRSSSSDSSWSSWSSSSPDYEDEQTGRRGASIGIILLCVFGAIVALIIYALCRRCTSEPESPRVASSQSLYSEEPRNETTPTAHLNSSPTATESANNTDRNTSANIGQNGAYVGFTPTITSLLDDYMATRAQHTTPSDLTLLFHPDGRIESAMPSHQGALTPVVSSQTSDTSPASDEDTRLIPNSVDGATYMDPAPNITSLIEEYLSSRDQHAPSASAPETSSSPSCGVSATAVSDSTTPESSSSSSNEDVSLVSNNGNDIVHTAGPPSSITSLIEEYLSTRNQPVPSDRGHPDAGVPAILITEASGATPTAPRLDQAPSVTPDTSPRVTHPAPAPSIGSLIDEYLATRHPSRPRAQSQEQGHEHPTLRDMEPAWSEPPQYEHVVSGMNQPSPTSTVEVPPPSYESLFGGNQS